MFSKVIGTSPNSSNGEPEYLDLPFTDSTSTSPPKDPDLESDLTAQPLIKFENGEYSTVKLDDNGVPETHSNGEYVYIKGVNPTTLTGRTIKCKQDD